MPHSNRPAVSPQASEDAIDRVQREWLRERPGTPVGPIGILTRIRLIARLLEPDHRRAAARTGLNAPTRDLLSTLRRSGSPYRLAPGTIAERSLLTPGAISQRVASAERDGLVRRRRASGDARGVVVELTAAGHERIERALDELLLHEEQLLGGLTAAERARIEDALRLLLARLADRLGQ